jgi:hypothetical protein
LLRAALQQARGFGQPSSKREIKSFFELDIALQQKNILLSSALPGCTPVRAGEWQMTETARVTSPAHRIATVMCHGGLSMRCRRFSANASRNPLP